MFIDRINKYGFSLLEVLIFITILGMFFVTAAAVVVASLRTMQINEHKILATRYAEELYEWIKDEKEADWSQFVAREGPTYCFNDELTSVSTWLQISCPDYEGIKNIAPEIFKREVSIERLPVGGPYSQVNVTITVSWQEYGNTYQVPIKTVFSAWEQ